MSLGKRDLQRRYNLPQSVPSSNLLHHFHSVWDDRFITLFAGDKSYNNAAYVPTGAKILINPLILMYAVKAELVLTTTFVPAGDSYTVKLTIGSSSYEYNFTNTTTHENVVTDIEADIVEFFKVFREDNFSIEIKVSNTANPVTLYGVNLKFTIYLEDSYGDYTNIVTSMLTDSSDIDKSFIKSLDEESKDFTYISGIVPR